MLLSVLSVRRPTAVDRQQGAGDRGCFVGAEECGEGGDLGDFDELFGGLRRQQNVFITASSLIPRALACSGICF